jgi:hypothetical protein
VISPISAFRKTTHQPVQHSVQPKGSLAATPLFYGVVPPVPVGGDQVTITTTQDGQHVVASS